MVFWGSYNITLQNKWNPLKAAMFTSVCETLVDFPAEQVKVRRMLSNTHVKIKDCFRTNNYIGSITTMLTRNFTFLLSYHMMYQNLDNKNGWNAPIAGLFGSIVSHPFDTLKTLYQSSQHSLRLNITMVKPEYLFRGCGHRCLANFLGMGIGDFVIRSTHKYT
jgi:hypothetical protein